MPDTEQLALETRVALMEQAVSRMGGDVAFIRSKMEQLEHLMSSLIRIEERMSTHTTDITRAFDAIRDNTTAIASVKSAAQIEKEKTDKWINIAVGIWIAATMLWILFGSAIFWWVSRINEHLKL